MHWVICLKNGCLLKASHTHYHCANKLTPPPWNIPGLRKCFSSTTYKKDCCWKAGYLCPENSLSVDPCNAMVLIHPTGMKLPDKNRRHLNTKQRESKLQKCLLRSAQNRRDNNTKESEINNNNVDTVSDYANNCGDVQKRWKKIVLYKESYNYGGKWNLEALKKKIYLFTNGVYNGDVVGNFA